MSPLASTSVHAWLAAAETSSPAPCFQLSQQLLDAIFFLERGEAVFDVVDGDLGLGLADRFFARDFVLHAIEGRGLRSVADIDLGVASLTDGPGPPVLRDQQCGL